MSGVGDYMARACGAPLLTAKQEILLARQIREGSAEGATARQQRLARKAKDRLIMSNMRLVVRIARKFYPRCRTLTMEDLFQEGALGLNRATELFDPSRGYKFSTYSHRWIEHWIGRAVAEQDSTIRIPIHAAEGTKRYERAAQGRQGEPIDQHQVATEARTNVETVALTMRVRSVASLDHRRGDAEELGLWNMVTVPPAEETYAEELGLDAMHLQRCLLQLTPTERTVLRLKFGLGGCDPATLDAIGEKVGLSRERTRNLKNRALVRLRKTLQSAL